MKNMIKSIGKTIGLSALVICVFILLFTTLRFTLFSVVGTLYGVFQPAPVNATEPWNQITNGKICSEYRWMSDPITNLRSIQIHSSNVLVSGSYDENNSSYCEYNLQTGAIQQTFQDPIFTSESDGKPMLVFPDCNNPDTTTPNHPAIYYLVLEDKMVAVQSSPAGNSILWKLDLLEFDKDSDLENSYFVRGLLQDDEVITYPICTYHTNTDRLWDIYIRAISKKTGKLTWEKDLVLHKNYSYLEAFSPKSIQSDGIGVYHICPKELSDFEETLYVYNLEKQSIEWKKRLNFGTLSVDHFLRGDTLYTLSAQLPELFLGKTNYYDIHIPTGKIVSQGVYPSKYGDRLIDKTCNRMIMYEKGSKQVFALQSFSKKPIWYAKNVTGFSTLLSDHTVVLILQDRYVCHMNSETGELIHYWNIKNLLGENYSVQHVQNNCETGFNQLTVSNSGTLLLCVTTSPEAQYSDSISQIVAIDLGLRKD
jgi:hypothetical protein